MNDAPDAQQQQRSLPPKQPPPPLPPPPLPPKPTDEPAPPRTPPITPTSQTAQPPKAEPDPLTQAPHPSLRRKPTTLQKRPRPRPRSSPSPSPPHTPTTTPTSPAFLPPPPSPSIHPLSASRPSKSSTPAPRRPHRPVPATAAALRRPPCLKTLENTQFNGLVVFELLGLCAFWEGRGWRYVVEEPVAVGERGGEVMGAREWAGARGTERWRRSEEGGMRKKLGGMETGIGMEVRGITGHAHSASCDARIEGASEPKPYADIHGREARGARCVKSSPPPPHPLLTGTQPDEDTDLHALFLRANTDPCRASDVPTPSALAQTRQQITARLRSEQKHYDAGITSSEDSEPEKEKESSRVKGLRRFNTLIGKRVKKGLPARVAKGESGWRSVEGLGHGGSDVGEHVRSASVEVLRVAERGRMSGERPRGGKGEEA